MSSKAGGSRSLARTRALLALLAAEKSLTDALTSLSDFLGSPESVPSDIDISVVRGHLQPFLNVMWHWRTKLQEKIPKGVEKDTSYECVCVCVCVCV
jgi:hypothetical protein